MPAIALSATTLGLAALAGVVTTLSPCVLPVLPLVAASASGRSRWGLLTLALGLALSFTVVGVVVTSSGALLGLSERGLRWSAGALMIAVGTVMLVPSFRHALERLAGGAGNFGGQAAARIRSDHPAAQFAVGALMGVAWSPCVGPTLGAAIALAASGRNLAEVSVVMLVFSLSAVIPLIALGAASRAWFLRNQQRALRFGQIGRWLISISLILIGLTVLTGWDKLLETWLLDFTPAWLIELTTRF